jgi:hypothetical protein
MGHIKEPKGVDFVIQSRSLTKDEELAISKYIKEYKLKRSSAAKNAKMTKVIKQKL